MHTEYSCSKADSKSTGNQFINTFGNQSEQTTAQNAGLGLNGDQSPLLRVVMGDNMANQADFGRGAGVGATSDVFANKYCVAAPSDPSVANQSFFGGCN